MAWEHFEINDGDFCNVLEKASNELCECLYEIGTLTTGKSRVFWGYQIIVYYKGVAIAGRSKGYSETYSLALKDCNSQMAEQGLILLVAGNLSTYSESAMTGPAGYGYLRDNKTAVKIMSTAESDLKIE
jgi:hypothetical protein